MKENDQPKLSPGALIVLSIIFGLFAGGTSAIVSGGDFSATIAGFMGGFLVGGLLAVILWK